MKEVRITVGADRNLCGSLRVLESEGRLIAGPFPIAARASDRVAAANANASRDPLFRYGDPPTGSYRVLAVKHSGGKSGLSGAEYGPNGILLLMPVSGEAALAEANGRYTVAILGGKLPRNDQLRSTAGAFRLRDEHMRALLRALGKDFGDVVCHCDLGNPAAGAAIVQIDNDCEQHDPISTGEIKWRTTRREAIMRAAGTAGIAAGVGILFVSPMFSTPAEAQVAYHGPSDFTSGTVHVDTAAEPESVASQIGGEVTSSARDLGVDVLNGVGGTPVPKASLPWVTPAAIMAGGLAGSAQLYQNGQTDAAIAGFKSTLKDALPEVVSSAATTALVPTLLETTLAVVVATGSMGVTLPVSAIVVTSVVVVVGVNAAISFGTKKLTTISIKYVQSNFKKPQ